MDGWITFRLRVGIPSLVESISAVAIRSIDRVSRDASNIIMCDALIACKYQHNTTKQNAPQSLQQLLIIL